MAVTTNTLQNILVHAGDYKKAVERNEDAFVKQTVSEHLNLLCGKYHVQAGAVIRKAGIERTYGCQIFNGTRNPSRDKLVQIAFGFGLSLEDTQELLKKSGKSALYSRIKRDAAFIFGLSHQIGFDEIQELLFSVGLPLLGEL